jgi:protein-disulfide isomerase
MKRYLPFIIVGVIAVATLGSGMMLYRAKRPHLLTIPQDKIVPGKSDTDSMHIRGAPDAAVTLEEFGDYQCPPCANIAGFIDELLKEYSPRLRIVFRNFPLPIHKHGLEAALAAEAAGIQGRYWEMHDLLYREQTTWSNVGNARELFNSYAGMLGLNVDQFKKDMDGEKAKARIDFDQERGKSLGVASTPTLFINNQEVGPMNKTPAGLRATIDAALKDKS